MQHLSKPSTGNEPLCAFQICTPQDERDELRDEAHAALRGTGASAGRLADSQALVAALQV